MSFHITHNYDFPSSHLLKTTKIFSPMPRNRPTLSLWCNRFDWITLKLLSLPRRQIPFQLIRQTFPPPVNSNLLRVPDSTPNALKKHIRFVLALSLVDTQFTVLNTGMTLEETSFFGYLPVQISCLQVCEFEKPLHYILCFCSK